MKASEPVTTHFSHAEEAYWARYARCIVPAVFIRIPILTSAITFMLDEREKSCDE